MSERFVVHFFQNVVGEPVISKEACYGGST
jgi:hypothetical protein